MCKFASKLKNFRFFNFFSKNPTFGKKRFLLKTTTILEEIYGEFEKERQKENFQRGFLRYRETGNFHLRKT